MRTLAAGDEIILEEGDRAVERPVKAAMTAPAPLPRGVGEGIGQADRALREQPGEADQQDGDDDRPGEGLGLAADGKVAGIEVEEKLDRDQHQAQARNASVERRRSATAMGLLLQVY